MTKHLITLPSGNKMAYWTHHAGKKKTLVLVHGFTGSHEGFNYLVPLLNDYHLVVPDLPGFGVSPLPHAEVTLQHLGNLLGEFVTSLGLEQPYFVGHSMGSLVVSEALRQYPGIAAKKLTFVSPVPSPVELVDRRRSGVFISQLYYSVSHRLPVVGPKLATSRNITRVSTHAIMTAKDKTLRKDIIDHHFTNLDFISSIEWYSKLYREINKSGLSRYRKVLKDFDVLIINGDKDTVTPLPHQRQAAKIIDAKIAAMPNVGHLAHYEKPADIATAIVDFLQ